MSRPEITLKNRREFLTFFGQRAAAAALAPTVLSFPLWLDGCASNPPLPAVSARASEGLHPLRNDDFTLVEGLQYHVLASWDDPINAAGDRFGFNNDFTQFFPLRENANEGLLWVNHEYVNPLFIHRRAINRQASRVKAEVLEEMNQVGGSILHLRRDASTGAWRMLPKSDWSRRVTGQTVIPFAWPEPIAGAKSAVGTIANCAGGRTPWDTVLTCEENYADFFGDVTLTPEGNRTRVPPTVDGVNWASAFNYPPEHYGWVVEVDPRTAKAKKLVALGRFAHEAATVRASADGRCAVYSGDDSADRCLYKFIASAAGSLERGTLHVANLAEGRWIPLDRATNPSLAARFRTQTEVLLYARQAAELVGGTPLDRPEDIEIDPRTGAVYIALTMNPKRGNPYGSILKIEEEGNDPLALKFRSSTFLTGGKDSLIACPDNLAFDPAGNLWVCNDISSAQIGHPLYEAFGNNGLFFIPMTGPSAGRPIQVGSAPIEAELTGPSFSPDGKTLFLSVQHPGEETAEWGKFTSHWPAGGTSIPRSAVVSIEGPLLERIYARSVQ